MKVSFEGAFSKKERNPFAVAAVCMSMRWIGLAIFAAIGPLARADDVQDLLQKMHAAYQKVQSADITIQSRMGTDEMHTTDICHIQFVAPNLLYETCTEKDRTPGMPEVGGFTYISDGKQLQTIGRFDGDSIKLFSPKSVQDDGVPVYKEALCFWDWDRQWSGEKGGVASGFRYQIKHGKWKGKEIIGLAEAAPDGEAFNYFIDPDTYMIEESVMLAPDDQGSGWHVICDYEVQKLVINPKIDPAIFKIKRG